MADFNYEDVGLKDYKECWDYQEEILDKISWKNAFTLLRLS